MKILIVGTGFLGSHAALALRKQGHLVTGTARSEEKAQNTLKSCDQYLLWNDETPEDFLEGYDILIFSAAPDIHGSYESTYLHNSQKIAQAAPLSSTLKQIIYTGSTSVYGECGGKEVDEETPLQPLTPSASVLCDTEEVFRTITACKVCIFRLGDLIGPGRGLAERLQNMRGRSFPGTGESFTNFSPLEEVVQGILFAIDKQLDGTFNLVSDLHVKRKDLYEQVAQENQLPSPVWDSTLPSSHGGNRIVLNDKIKKCGFQFTNKGITYGNH